MLSSGKLTVCLDMCHKLGGYKLSVYSVDEGDEHHTVTAL